MIISSAQNRSEVPMQVDPSEVHAVPYLKSISPKSIHAQYRKYFCIRNKNKDILIVIIIKNVDSKEVGF